MLKNMRHARLPHIDHFCTDIPLILSRMPTTFLPKSLGSINVEVLSQGIRVDRSIEDLDVVSLFFMMSSFIASSFVVSYRLNSGGRSSLIVSCDYRHSFYNNLGR